MAKAWKLTEEILKKVETLASRGLTQEQIAHCIGLYPTTLTKKKYQYEQLEQAINKGQSQGISIVANSLFEQAKKGNVAAAIFYLKNRAKWSDGESEKIALDIRNHVRKAITEALKKNESSR